jgi:hypothetical protein
MYTCHIYNWFYEIGLPTGYDLHDNLFSYIKYRLKQENGSILILHAQNL